MFPTHVEDLTTTNMEVLIIEEISRVLKDVNVITIGTNSYFS